MDEAPIIADTSRSTVRSIVAPGQSILLNERDRDDDDDDDDDVGLAGDVAATLSETDEADEKSVFNDEAEDID